MPLARPSPQEQAFLQAIVDNPGDDAVYLILADWLEEYDDPRRAELLRLHRQLLASCCEPDEHPERTAWQRRLVQLLAEGVRLCVPRRSVDLGSDMQMAFAWLPPGSFLMGSPRGEEGRGVDETQHRVTLSRGFWLGVYPVMQAQWQAVLGSNPSLFQGPDRPVDNVSWEDGQEFCRKLSGRDGRHYRLPTEAEWEYACRAGTTTPFHLGQTISTDQANYNGTYSSYGKGKKGIYRKQTTAVGGFPPNAWGLFDLHGNVWEWCADRYGPYLDGVTKDPQNEPSGRARVLRGGSWRSGPWACRSAGRDRDVPTGRGGNCGCRVVLGLD
jgi:uncharacterized protein (TIGR02996 family)